ncbi:DUF2637 domain-containing protein [Streptomyces bathyalis]|uniref:DUF2637 domain-containing protein n=1 Tax=Streptomyces bathyalis TaxID=2710756 RepID=A0A7T1WQZ4_9ACTN|nr:DUF2637 domain-containing protein [Streptomyces bathyalis]QPP05964.1 DUF2637 domain-containing protein [Streptomyces bathyalis]
MTMTDLPLSGAVAGAVLLVGALAAVVLMARGRRANRRAGGDDGPSDSWEQMEQRRRRKETVYATAAYLLLFCCAAVAAALSFHGLVGFGRQNLRLSGGWEYLVPFGLDGAAMFSAVIAVREASHGDASLGSRLLVWAFAGAAAWFNWVHAPRGTDHAGAPEFFAGMSLSAAILFDRALKQTRRAALREQGLVPRPLPQIRVVRWLRAPRETFRAWSLMLLEGVRTLDQAVEEVRDERRQHEQERLRRKEQQKLDRAKVKALGRQHRGHGRRGPGKPDGTRAEYQAAVPASQVSADPAVAMPSLPAQSTGGRGDDGAAGTAGPRLDSLEEKLAEIERQFG